MQVIFMLLLMVAGATMERTKRDKKEETFNYNFQQHDYEYKFERMELVRFNKDYMKFFSVHTYKYNRTSPVVNFTFTPNVDIGNEMEIIVQQYKFMSNEYRLFPLHFGVTFCKALNANMAGMLETFACGNFSGCPLLKGKTYHICNWSPNASKLPPFIPNGQYMNDMQAIIGATEVFVGRIYATIHRPIHWH